MAFLLYHEQIENEKRFITSLDQNFSLAGYTTIYNLWLEKGSPVNKGWKISSFELSEFYKKKLNIKDPLHFIIDFHPTSNTRIGLIEILNIYLFTFANDDGGVVWTPFMVKMQDIFYNEYCKDEFPKDKEEVINKIVYPPQNTKEFVEFLYLNGDDKGWNWGRNGMTNAVFIQGEAREYFRKYF